MDDKLARIEIQNQTNSDTYRALLVYSNGAEQWEQRDYQTIGEAARDLLDRGAPVYNCTGRKTVSRRNLIDSATAESGELG